MPRGEDVFVRLESRFILEDPRFLRHSLSARAVFVHLSAVAVRERREFLQARYNVDLLAVGMRCSPEEVRAGLAELTSAEHEPLLERLADGRIRVVDVRKCHGARFRWLPEGDEFAAIEAQRNAAPQVTDNVPPSYPRTGTIGDERGQLSPIAPEVRGEMLEVRGERARRKTYGASGVPSHEDSDTANGITAPEGVAAEEWWRLLRLTAVWPAAGKGTGIERLAAIMRGGGPDDAERHVRMVDEAWKAGKLRKSGKAGLPWAVLGKNGFDPPDGIEAMAKSLGKGGEVLALGDILPRPP